MVGDGDANGALGDDARRFLSALDCLDADLDVLIDIGPDSLSEFECEEHLKRLEVAVRRVSSVQTRFVGSLADRRIAKAKQAARETGRAPEAAAGRARRDVEDFLSNELGMSPTDARNTTQDGQRRGRHQGLDRARDAGDIGARHAKLVADFLGKLPVSGTSAMTDEQRCEVEQEAVAQARRCHPVELSNWLRKRLGELNVAQAERDEASRRRRRSVRATMGDDGMWHMSADLAAVDAGIVTQALDAFRVHDGPDVPIEHRRAPDQITADALVQLCRVALEADATGSRGGTRPHIVVTIDYQTLLAEQGNVDIERVGTAPFQEVRRLLADAGVARLLVDPKGVPLEAGADVRTVPAGLRRALVQRDQGCVAIGCSIPARWCQVAHLDRPYRFDGVLSLDNAALMCQPHHTNYDLHGWPLAWDQDRPRLHPPRGAHQQQASIEGKSGSIDKPGTSGKPTHRNSRGPDSRVPKGQAPDAQATDAQEPDRHALNGRDAQPNVRAPSRPGPRRGKSAKAPPKTSAGPMASGDAWRGHPDGGEPTTGDAWRGHADDGESTSGDAWRGHPDNGEPTLPFVASESAGPWSVRRRRVAPRHDRIRRGVRSSYDTGQVDVHGFACDKRRVFVE